MDMLHVNLQYLTCLYTDSQKRRFAESHPAEALDGYKVAIFAYGQTGREGMIGWRLSP